MIHFAHSLLYRIYCTLPSDWEVDRGVLLDNLPVSAFRYGLLHEESEAKITIGRLVGLEPC